MLNSEDLSFNYSERRTLVAHEVNRHFQMQNNILNLHSCRLSSATWKSRSDAFQLQGRVSCVHVKTFGVELSQSHVHGKLQRSTGNIYRQWAEEKIWRYNNTNTAEPPFAEKPTCFVRRSFPRFHFCILFSKVHEPISDCFPVSAPTLRGGSFPLPAVSDSWGRALLRHLLSAVMFFIWLENIFRPGPGGCC